MPSHTTVPVVPTTSLRQGNCPPSPDVGKVDVDQAWLDDDVRDAHHALHAKAAPTTEAAVAVAAAAAPRVAANRTRGGRGRETTETS